MSEKYNGWSNYETWAVALWLDNDAGTYEYVRELTHDTYDNARAERYFTREERARLDLEDALKEYIEENNPLANNASMYSDLLSAAISSVNWREIAGNYIDELDKSEWQGDEETEPAE